MLHAALLLHCPLYTFCDPRVMTLHHAVNGLLTYAACRHTNIQHVAWPCLVTIASLRVLLLPIPLEHISNRFSPNYSQCTRPVVAGNVTGHFPTAAGPTRLVSHGSAPAALLQT